MRGVTDHVMLRAYLKYRVRRKVRWNGVKVPKSVNVSKLKDFKLREEL